MIIYTRAIEPGQYCTLSYIFIGPAFAIITLAKTAREFGWCWWHDGGIWDSRAISICISRLSYNRSPCISTWERWKGVRTLQWIEVIILLIARNNRLYEGKCFKFKGRKLHALFDVYCFLQLIEQIPHTNNHKVALNWRENYANDA